MRLDDDGRVYLYSDLTLTVDPTGSTVKLEVDGVLHNMSWQEEPVVSGSTWRQTARTVAMFCGSAVTPTGSDVQLTVGRHMSQPIVTAADGQIIPGSQIPIDVR